MAKLITLILTLLEYATKAVIKTKEKNEDKKVRDDPSTVWSDEFGVTRVRDEDESPPTP